MTTAIALPKRAKELLALAREHGWQAVVRADGAALDGATESAMLCFDLELLSGRAFAFACVVAKSSTNRWQFCRDEDGYSVTGALFPGEGTDTDRLANMLGATIAERRWKAISNLEWWLARPEAVARFDWVGDDLAEPTSCACHQRSDA